MMTRHASLIALMLMAGCGRQVETGSTGSALQFPVTDGGACTIGETGCNGLGTALYSCVADKSGESHWGSPTLCPGGCVTVAPASNGLENDACRQCYTGSRRISNVDNECVVQTCNIAGAWGTAQPFHCIPGFVLDESTCSCSCVNPKCQQTN